MSFNLPERYLIAINALLVILIAAFGALCASDVISMRLSGQTLAAAGPALVTAEPRVVPRSRSYYSVITRRDIFNLAPAPAAETPASANLPITLIGTSHLSGRKPFIIVADQTGSQTLYRLGDTIPNAGKVVEVGHDRAIIEVNGRRVTIELPHAGSGPGVPEPLPAFRPNFPARPEPPPEEGKTAGIRRLPGDRFVISRATVTHSTQDMAQLLTELRATPNLQNGTSNGFRLSEIQPGSVFDQIGLQDGDVVTAIAGQPISDPGRAMQLLGSLGNTSAVSVNVLRNGAPVTLSYIIR